MHRLALLLSLLAACAGSDRLGSRDAPITVAKNDGLFFAFSADPHSDGRVDLRLSVENESGRDRCVLQLAPPGPGYPDVDDPARILLSAFAVREDDRWLDIRSRGVDIRDLPFGSIDLDVRRIAPGGTIEARWGATVPASVMTEDDRNGTRTVLVDPGTPIRAKHIVTELTCNSSEWRVDTLPPSSDEITVRQLPVDGGGWAEGTYPFRLPGERTFSVSTIFQAGGA